MILHASTKMDISNYVDWLRGRLNDGYFDRENGNTVNRILLKDIEKIYLYTKTPSKVYRSRELFLGYNPRLITFLTQYDSFFEPKIKDKDKIIRCIQRCRKHFKENYFGYGPIFYTAQHDMNWHLAQFEMLCEVLEKYTDGAYISFRINERCQKDKKMSCRPLDYSEQSLILQKIEEIADRYKLKVELMRYEDEFDDNEIDIGENNCCPYACEYCPYITNKSGAMGKYKMFNPESSMMYGFITKSQKIKEISVDNTVTEEENVEEGQVSLFDFMNT